jgi:hypothetical protein
MHTGSVVALRQLYDLKSIHGVAIKIETIVLQEEKMILVQSVDIMTLVPHINDHEHALPQGHGFGVLKRVVPVSIVLALPL